MKIRSLISCTSLLAFLLAVAGQAAAQPTTPQAKTYYVSTSGKDVNDGLSELKPLQTVAKVNGLDLQPGDRVLFKCGDTWHAEQLVISQSGSESAAIIFGSYPA